MNTTPLDEIISLSFRLRKTARLQSILVSSTSQHWPKQGAVEWFRTCSSAFQQTFQEIATTRQRGGSTKS